MLLQSAVGNAAPLGGLLHRDVVVRAQEFHSPGVLLIAEPACAARQVVAYAQPFTHLLAPLYHTGIVRAQLTAKVRAVQSELTGDLRNVELYIVHAVARLDGLPVFGTGGGQLTAKLPQLYMTGFLPAADDIVTSEQHVTVIFADISPEPRYRHLASTADFCTGQPG